MNNERTHADRGFGLLQEIGGSRVTALGGWSALSAPGESPVMPVISVTLPVGAPVVGERGGRGLGLEKF